MQLITYADRLGGDLAGLASLLEHELAGLFAGVHILPFFDPIDGADAGFDPIDHTRVDPRLGDWPDIARLSQSHRIMADLIVNHVSAQSEPFQHVLAHGEASPHWPLFLKKDDVFPGDDSAIARIYRPRPGPPFTTKTLSDGSTHEFWTTFSDNQIDINVESAAGRAYLDSVLERFATSGVREIRLDAAGYAIKRPGTSCFMLPETYAFIATLSERALAYGMTSLVEIHSHHQTQIDIAAEVGRVYDFALPPLVLHALYRSDARPLKDWLAIAPRNCVTVLDTHDGIGIVDVGPEGNRPGLLGNEQLSELVEAIHRKTQGDSRRASGSAASNLDIYQVNATYYDALGRDDVDYLIARAIQFFCPGTPQVYYVGLLAGHNATSLVHKTGVGRDINRDYYLATDVRRHLDKPVVRALRRLIEFRNSLGAFDGDFSLCESPDHTLELRWCAGREHASLNVDLLQRRATLTAQSRGAEQSLVIAAGKLGVCGTNETRDLPQ